MWMFLVSFICLMNWTEERGPHHPRQSEIISYHSHYKPDGSIKITQDEQLLQDVQHLKEHLEEEIETIDLSKMTEEELEFYYFQVHDTDKNSKLDGLEILQAIFHTSHDEEEDKLNDNNYKTKQFDDYVELIDKVLREDDTDNDGYLSYPEYVEGRKKDTNDQQVNIKPAISSINTQIPVVEII